MAAPIPITLLFFICGAAGAIAYFFLNKKRKRLAFACLVLGIILLLMALIPWLAILLSHMI